MRGHTLEFYDTMHLFIKNDVVLDAPERNIRTEVGCLCLAAMFFFPEMLFSGLNVHPDKIVATPAKKCAPTGSVSALDTPAPADIHPKNKSRLRCDQHPKRQAVKRLTHADLPPSV